MKTVQFKFDNMEPCVVTEIQARGFIFSRMNNQDGQNEYKVSFWLDGQKKQEWFYEFELSQCT